MEDELQAIIKDLAQDILREPDMLVEFLKYMDKEEFDNMYDMLSDDIKSSFNREDMMGIIYPNSSSDDSSYYQGMTPYKEIGLKFARYVVDGEYESAYELLSDGLKSTLSVDSIERDYLDMIDYFESIDIYVDSNFVEVEGALCSENSIYIPIEESGNSEAIIVKLIDYNGAVLIDELEWGRP